MMLKWILGLIGENSWEFRDDKKDIVDIQEEEEEEMGYQWNLVFFGLEVLEKHQLMFLYTLCMWEERKCLRTTQKKPSRKFNLS